MKSGFVTIIGRPNVGKSTLINSLIGQKVAITSNVAGTTRNAIQGIYNDKDSQIIFVDTPGIHKPKDKLNEFMNKESYNTILDIDIILFMVDASTKLGKGDKFILEKIKNINSNVFLILNKIDKIKKDNLFEIINKYVELYNFTEVIPLSASKKDNLDELIKTIKKYLKEGQKYYDDDLYTNKNVNFIVTELVREKVLRLTKEEVPHNVTCLIENFDEKKNKVIINMLIIVQREGIKKILVGHNGSMIKKIGTDARVEIEELLGKKVYLELFVKVVSNWREEEKYLKEFGYSENTE